MTSLGAGSLTRSCRNFLKETLYRFNHRHDVRDPDSMPPEPGLVNCLQGHFPEILDRWLDNQLNPELLSQYAIETPRQLGRQLLAETFSRPLLQLLIEYLRTGNPRFCDIYLDERLRYAPHTLSAEYRQAFFTELLDRDLQAVLEASRPDADLKLRLLDSWRSLHAPLLLTAKSERLKLLAVGDCLLNELRVFLPRLCRKQDFELETRCIYFSAQQGRSLSIDTVLQHITDLSPDFIALSFLTYEGIPFYRALLNDASRLSSGEKEDRVAGILGVMQEFLNELRKHTSIPFLLHNACGLPLQSKLRIYFPWLKSMTGPQQEVVDLLNAEIGMLAGATTNCLLVDENAVTRKWGLRQCTADCVPPRIGDRASFHTSQFGVYLTKPYLEAFRTYRLFAKLKVLCLDFDNTLWDGVMADGEVTQFTERQQLLKLLNEAGILLVAVSKNDPLNIRWNEMTLQEDDFVLTKISWGLKPEAVATAAEELSLGLDTFIFIDDNPVERELVKSQVPAVRCLDADDPVTWTGLEAILQFPITSDTEEARTRTQMYQASAKRQQSMTSKMDFGAMMHSLELETNFGPAQQGDLTRVGELVQRTNQFNTTTIRYSNEDLEKMIASTGHRIYVAELADKFGKLGVVSVVIIERLPDGVAKFDTFIMSCRAMGFGLEQLVLSLVCERENDANRFVGRYIATDRNAPCSDLYVKGGFTRQDDTDLILDGGKIPERPDWFTIIERT